jgi:hypothetical protein
MLSKRKSYSGEPGGCGVAPQPSSEWRLSIQMEAKPFLFAGAWSWNRLWAV